MDVYEVFCEGDDLVGYGTVQVLRGLAASKDDAKLQAMRLMPRGMRVATVVCRWPLDW